MKMIKKQFKGLKYDKKTTNTKSRIMKCLKYYFKNNKRAANGTKKEKKSR